MDDLAVNGGRQQIAYRSRSPSLGEIDSIFSDESSSPNSVDSECSFETTESSLDEELQASGERTVSRQSSIVDGLLNEIYDRYHHGSRSGDSDNVTEYSTTSFYSGSFELDERTQRWSRTQLNNKGMEVVMLASLFSNDELRMVFRWRWKLFICARVHS